MAQPFDPVQTAEEWLISPEQRITGVHLANQCEGPCILHSPTDHSMRGFKLLWRTDRGIFERVCEHGVGHPDPDQIPFWAANRGVEYAEAETVHGCDGCCRP